MPQVTITRGKPLFRNDGEDARVTIAFDVTAIIEYHIEILSDVCELSKFRPADTRGIVDEELLIVN